MPCSDVLN